MKSFLSRHRETLLVTLLGLLVMASLNILMLQWHQEMFTNPRLGAWSVFWNFGEFSGFDTYTYIVVSSFRPVYVLVRHPILAMMLYPAYELNDWLRDLFHINCAIYVVAVMWVMLATCSWLLMYRILRKLIGLPCVISLVLTFFFFSFSHVMIITFFPDHMSMTLPLLLLAIYLSGKAIKKHHTMPLWQSLPLAFIATGVTTTNIIKIAIADFFTLVGKKTFPRVCLHFLCYLLPLALLFWAYSYQLETTQKAEKAFVQRMIDRKAKSSEKFAKQQEMSKKKHDADRVKQIIDNPMVAHTEYHIDRIPSLVENIFGEGLLLHEDYTLKDANREGHRPVLVRYNHWWYYGVEAVIVVLFLSGVWCGRHERLMWIVMSMFLFDMLLHVGLNFASADVYIMTAHWAFVMPVAIGYLVKSTFNRNIPTPFSLLLLIIIVAITAFLWWHNLSLVVQHILGF